MIGRYTWGWYAGCWLAASLLWSMAATSAGMRPVDAVRYGLLLMTVAAIMGLGVWRLTAHVEWPPRVARFWLAHACALSLYASGYVIAPFLADVPRQGVLAIAQAWSMPVTSWNLLMGCSVYMIVVGLSYAVRSEARYRHAAEAVAQAHLLARDAQLAALRAQVNPHFLFNALHSVSALVRSDADAADRAIDQLGGLLRYALRDGDELVTLEEEWQFTARYLELERLRLGTRLRVDAAFDAAARAWLMPAFTLQPLVENAVRHGLSRPIDDRCVVTIRSRTEAGALRLLVANSVGPEQPAIQGSGTGLNALRRRLELRYGSEQAAIYVRRAEGRFEVEVVLPRSAAAEAT